MSLDPSPATRGERNCNPGNLEYSPATVWFGLDVPAADGRFCRFTDPLHGIRALAKTLVTYQNRDDCVTLAQIIHRWAPPAENNTDAYLNDVCQRTGMLATSVPSLTSGSTDLADVVTAIIFHENGRCIYAPELIGQAAALAVA